MLGRAGHAKTRLDLPLGLHALRALFVQHTSGLPCSRFGGCDGVGLWWGGLRAMSRVLCWAQVRLPQLLGGYVGYGMRVDLNLGTDVSVNVRNWQTQKVLRRTPCRGQAHPTIAVFPHMPHTSQPRRTPYPSRADATGTNSDSTRQRADNVPVRTSRLRTDTTLPGST